MNLLIRHSFIKISNYEILLIKLNFQETWSKYINVSLICLYHGQPDVEFSRMKKINKNKKRESCDLFV